MTSASDRAGLVHVLRALGDGLVEVIVVGGWAHRLHTHHPLATATGNPLHTLDADLWSYAWSHPLAYRLSARSARLAIGLMARRRAAPPWAAPIERWSRGRAMPMPARRPWHRRG